LKVLLRSYYGGDATGLSSVKDKPEDDRSILEQVRNYLNKGINEDAYDALGPHAAPALIGLGSLLGEILGPGADVRDAVTASGETTQAVKEGDILGAGVGGLNTLASLAMMALPGSVGGVKKITQEVSENIPTRWYRGTDNPKELQNPAKWTFGKEGSLGGGGVYITPNPEGASRYASEGWDGTRTKGGFVTPLDVIFDKPLIIDLNKDTGYFVETRALEALGVPSKKAENIAEKALEDKGGFTTELKKRALDQGYDGIIVKMDGEITEAISYKPEKSIISSITKKNQGGSVVERNPYANYQPKAI
jgi:hypothetical protein